MDKFSVISPIQYVGKTKVRNNETGEVFDAEYRFTGTPFDYKEEENEVKFSFVQNGETRWELIIRENNI